jgi:hypothetical protein
MCHIPYTIDHMLSLSLYIISACICIHIYIYIVTGRLCVPGDTGPSGTTWLAIPVGWIYQVILYKTIVSAGALMAPTDWIYPTDLQNQCFSQGTDGPCRHIYIYILLLLLLLLHFWGRRKVLQKRLRPVLGSPKFRNLRPW